MLRSLVLFAVLGFAFANPTQNQSSRGNLLETNEDVKINPDTLSTRSAKSELSLEEKLEQKLIQYLKGHEISVDMPSIGSKVIVGARNLDNEELSFKLNFGSGSEVEARKKSKIKKIFVPLLVIILLKAIIFIPLAIGILGIKTWNAVQLSFISFVSALVLGVWKLCSKINHDSQPQIIHSAWDPHHHDRSDAQQVAYSAYAPQQ